MKIAFVYDVPYPWHKGGIEHILSVEAEELAKEHEVHFFTLRWPGMEHDFVHNRVHYHAYGEASESNVYRHSRRSVREAIVFSIYSLNIFRYGFDAIITNEFPVLHLLPVRLYCLFRKCRLAIRFDEVWERDYWVRYLGSVLGHIASWYSEMLIRSKSAMYIADFGRIADTLKLRGIPTSQISVFTPILDKKEFGGKSEVKREKRIIFSGRLIKEKRIDRWLRVVHEVVKRDRTVKGLIVGEGVEESAIRREIKKLGLEGSVRVVGFYKDKRQLYTEISRSSLLLHMSEREGLSIITLESIALGTPVLLPENSPISEEAQSMCIVAAEDKLAVKAIEIISSDDKEQYVKNSRNLRLFYIQDVRGFYKSLFSRKL